MLSAQKQLGAARAFLVVQPDNGRALFAGDGLGDLCSRSARQAQRGRDRGAEG